MWAGVGNFADPHALTIPHDKDTTMIARLLKVLALAVTALSGATIATAATQPIGVPFVTFSTGGSANNAVQNATLTISRACAPGHYTIISAVKKQSIRGSYWSATVKAVCTL